MREVFARWRIVLIGLILLLAGCGDPQLESLDRKLTAIRNDPGEAPRLELPEIPQYESVPYDEADIRPPFMPRWPLEDESPVGSQELAPDFDRPRQPLEAFDRDNLDLVGTLTVDGEPSALVRAPNGQVHRLEAGDYLGTDFGRIVDIETASIELVEVVPTGSGGWIERKATMTLQDD